MLLKSHFGVIILVWAVHCNAQYRIDLSSKVSIEVNANLETYFFAEKLAVEKIDNFVFDHSGEDYSHQPIVYFGFQHFRKFKDLPSITRIAELLKQIRDTYYDNAPITNYLITLKEFPAIGSRYEIQNIDTTSTQINSVLKEIADSLRRFYIQANVGKFLKDNAAFYQGALKEEVKDIDVLAYTAMESWYGKTFPHYIIFLVPSMPITAGEDNYRGIGTQIHSPGGLIPAMMISSETMVARQSSLSDYRKFGFDNPRVTRMLTKHEMGHSFINPLLEKYRLQLEADSGLYTPGLKEVLSPHYINDWFVCVIEHLVRLGEIRSAVMIKNITEAQRLRSTHIGEYKCVLLPLLENKIQEYENNGIQQPDFDSYLPKLMLYLHSLNPVIIDEQVQKFKVYLN